jgi:hypothetical protein
MQRIADEIFVPDCQAEGHGTTDMTGGWVVPTVSRRHPVETEIMEDQAGKAPGGRSGRGFPPVKSSVRYSVL